MSKREEFKSLLDSLQALRHGRNAAYEFTHPLYDEMDNLLLAACPKLKRCKRNKYGHVNWDKAVKYLGEEQAEDIVKPVSEKSKQLMADWSKREEEIKRKLAELADETPIKYGEKRLYRTVGESEYRSQTNSVGYARAEAESHMDKCLHHGCLAEIQQRVDKWASGAHNYSLTYFDVMVEVESDLDIQILKYRSSIPLREEVRLCWKRGCNPRVRMSWLPHGYEESVGIDYFGRDLRKEKHA